MSGPDVWGPHGWKFIHYITLGYPIKPTIEIKQQYLNFFNTLKNVIPCSICGNNYRKHIKQFPLTNEILDDKKKFINWGITMHNLVNILNNKKEYENDEAIEEIIKNCTGDCPGYTNTNIEELTRPQQSNTILIVVIVLLIGIILFQFFYKKHIN
jgi:hypothetical protein